MSEEEYYLSEEEDTKKYKNHTKSLNNSNINNQSYDDDFQNNDLDHIKDMDVEINELQITNSNRNTNREINQIKEQPNEILINADQIHPPEENQLKNNEMNIQANEEISTNPVVIQSTNTVLDLNQPTKLSNQTQQNRFTPSASASQNEEITFKTKHPNNNHFIDISLSRDNLGRNNNNLITSTLSLKNESVKQSIEPQKARNKSSHVRSEELGENSFLMKKLAETEKEYFELKYLMEQTFVSNEIKQTHFKKAGNSQKVLEILNEEHQILTRNYDKFSQIFRVLLNMKFPDYKPNKSKTAPKNWDKILNKFKSDYDDLSNRFKVISDSNFLEKLEHDLAEINHHINFLENENRLSRHSKKKSEIKFDKTHKVLPTIDGKKIYQEYNMQFEQNNIIIEKINKNKSLIKEKELKIVKFNEDLEKLKVINDFYENNVGNKSETNKNLQDFVEKMKVLEGNKEELIRKNELILLKNKDLIDSLLEKKERFKEDLKDKYQVLKEVIENLTTLLEANNIRDTPKKNLQNKNKIDVVILDKKQRLDTIHEKENDNNNQATKPIETKEEVDFNRKEKDMSELVNLMSPISPIQMLVEGRKEEFFEKKEENKETTNIFEENVKDKDNKNDIEKSEKEVNSVGTKAENKNEEKVNELIIIQGNYKQDEEKYLIDEKIVKKMSKEDVRSKENGIHEIEAVSDHEQSEKHLSYSVINKLGERDMKSVNDIDKKQSYNFDFNYQEQADGSKEKSDQDSILITLKELDKKSSGKATFEKRLSSKEGTDKQVHKMHSNDSKVINECYTIKEKNDGKGNFFKENSQSFNVENELKTKLSQDTGAKSDKRNSKFMVKNGKEADKVADVEIPVFLKDLKTETLVKKETSKEIVKSQEIVRTEANRSPLIFSDIFGDEDVKPTITNEKTKKTRKEFDDLFKEEPQNKYSVSNNNVVSFNTKSNRNEKVKTEKVKVKIQDDLDDLII